mmetsp:Transcript_10124/g.18560  ORF Transcript_10124/g.18560 Transcript_10124/m.18560 type:complete len:213 (+) Transcript_10124:858-1496(+)
MTHHQVRTNLEKVPNLIVARSRVNPPASLTSLLNQAVETSIMMPVGLAEMATLMVPGVDPVVGTTSKRIHRGVVPPNPEKDQNPIAANRVNLTASLESLMNQVAEALKMKMSGTAPMIKFIAHGANPEDGGMEKTLPPHRQGSRVSHRESPVNHQENQVTHPESQERAQGVMEDGTMAAGGMEGTILALSRHPSRSQFQSQNQLMCPPQSPR